MVLRVEPDKIKDFARDMDRVSRAAFVGESYAGEHAQPATGGGSAMVRLLNSTTQVRPTVCRFFEHLGRLAELSADELVATARYYEVTDERRAQRADRLHQVADDIPTGAESY